MAGLGKELWNGLARQADDRLSGVDAEMRTASTQDAVRLLGDKGLKALAPYFEAGNRPADRTMRALDAGRVQVPEKHLPGLSPTLAEMSAQRKVDAAQELLIPKWPPVEREPIVSSPERMSDERNARLFPISPSNDDDDRGR